MTIIVKIIIIKGGKILNKKKRENNKIHDSIIKDVLEEKEEFRDFIRTFYNIEVESKYDNITYIEETITQKEKNMVHLNWN